jgi:probable phosphoglycerate mutase
MGMTSTRFCIVRHGETDWNAEQRIQGQRDLPLNAEGIFQAHKLGCYFASRTLDAIYSSDLVRAHATAEPIAETQKLPIHSLRQLRERAYGRCEGMTRSEVALNYPEDARAMHERRPDYVIPDGESLGRHRERVLDCVTELARRHDGQTILLVTHGGVLDLIYREASGMPIENPRNFQIPNAGINWMIVEDGVWRITRWAETSHLESGAPSEVHLYF